MTPWCNEASGSCTSTTRTWISTSRGLLGREIYEGSDREECFDVASRIPNGNVEAWQREWAELAKRVEDPRGGRGKPRRFRGRPEGLSASLHLLPRPHVHYEPGGTPIPRTAGEDARLLPESGAAV